jgi:hypothetical protein
MNTKPTERERRHMAKVKELPCSVCGLPGPSEAHHIKQSNAYTCLALCESCHRSPVNGLHGQRRMWAVNKMEELDALAVTIENLMKSV